MVSLTTSSFSLKPSMTYSGGKSLVLFDFKELAGSKILETVQVLLQHVMADRQDLFGPRPRPICWVIHEAELHIDCR